MLNSRQLANTLRSRIETGAYAPGQWLPAERDLTGEFQVHRRTIRSAIALLSQEGRLLCRPRCRPIVTSLLSPNPGSSHPVTETPTVASRLVALVMWHGGLGPRTTAQQRIFWGLQRTLSQRGYHGVFLDLGETIASEEENAAHEAAHLRYAQEHKFAGIVFYAYAYRSNRELIRETARQMPLVLIDRQIPGVETDYVGINNFQAMQEATHHLLAQGHRKVALVTMAEPINTVQDRIAGYRDAMRRSEIGDPRETAGHVITVNSALEWTMFDMIFRLPRAERPTALLCVNDSVALLVAERLAACGLCIPADVALASFDDLMQTLPSGIGLTSIAQPFEEIGRQAARLLLERLAAPALQVRQVELPAALCIRESTGARLRALEPK